jgi:hypothetical protein
MGSIDVILSTTLETKEYLRVGLTDGLMKTTLEKSEHKDIATISQYYIVDKFFLELSS